MHAVCAKELDARVHGVRALRSVWEPVAIRSWDEADRSGPNSLTDAKQVWSSRSNSSCFSKAPVTPAPMKWSRRYSSTRVRPPMRWKRGRPIHLQAKLTSGAMTETAIPSTTLFKTCRGVFQGGGCRGAAHIGAYDAAVQSGIELVEVAGTSAGSVIAALIGAGATPQYLLSHQEKLGFSGLLKPPEGVFKRSALRECIRMFTIQGNRSISTIRNVFLFGGRYSSRGIEAWIDERLAELLPHAPRPVRFSDLRLPTWVIAADLSAAKPKIWSTPTTPDTPVGFAVRCSCSMPLFFEPVPEGTNLYADGGMLSNLPTFVFSGNEDIESPHGEKILAFCLTDDSPPVREWSLMSLLQQLVNTVLSGSSDIQNSLQSSVSMIAIPTPGVKATDFDLPVETMTRLLESGREATFNFIRDEAVRFRGTTMSHVAVANEEELYDAIVREANDPGDELIVSCRNTDWYWKLFPTFAACRKVGAEVRVVLPPISEDSYHARQEKQRRQNLTALGASLYESNSLAHEAFVLSRKDRNQQAAFVLKMDENEHAPFATMYVGSSHTSAILSIKQAVCPDSTDEASSALELVKADATPIICKLKRGVRQYNNECLRIDLEYVATEEVHLIVRRVRAYKFQQIGVFRKLYEQSEVPLFGPAEFRYRGNAVSVTTPPVVEIWGDRVVVVEGNTRFLYAHRNGVERVVALVVRGVEAPLPGRPVPIRNAMLAATSATRLERIDGFNYSHFRSIERAARPLPPS